MGVAHDAADAVILAEARANGGALAEGESINLSFWSDRFGIPRAVLEALALSIGRSHRTASAPPAVAARSDSDEAIDPITPAPLATRRPAFEGAGAPSSR
jgi:hypothetical protein